MKFILRIIPVLLTGVSLARAHEESIDSTAALTTPTTACILGEIPDGTPPLPVSPKPKYQISEKEILSTATHEQGGRAITIRQIKPIALPPPTAPVQVVPAELDAEYSQRLAEYREANHKSGLLFVGATVFRSKDGPPRTLVRYWPEGKGEDITFWSSADFTLIAGGINSFVDSDGHVHHVFMTWDNVDLDRMTDLRASQGIEYEALDMPDFREDKASFKIIGEQPDAEKLVAIRSLHDLYNSEYERLKTAYEGRERARIEREEYLKANPPQPKDITLNYWRTEKPATNGKGAAK